MKIATAAVYFQPGTAENATLGATVQDYIHQAETQARLSMDYPGSGNRFASARFKLLTYAFYTDSFGRTWLTVTFRIKTL
jgi:hypothetical protein